MSFLGESCAYACLLFTCWLRLMQRRCLSYHQRRWAKYDSWWKQWGRSSSRDSDATIASSATESDGTDVMQTVQQMAPGPLKLEVLMQKEPVPAEVQPRPEQVQAPSVPVQSPGVPVQAPAAPKVQVSPGLEPVPNRSAATSGWGCNSSTHMAEWKCFSRFCLNNHDQCSSLFKAWKRLVCSQARILMCELMLHPTRPLICANEEWRR